MDKKTQKELLNIVKDNYEQISLEFDASRGKYPWPGLFNLFKNIKEGDSILDVGCGNGRLIKVFEEKNIKYLGVDLSKKLIEACQKRYPKHRFVVGDILNLGEVPEYNFDYVAAIAVLHHVPGRDLQINALKQLKNKIREDGRIILTVWNLWSQKRFKKLIFKFLLLKLIKKHKMDFGDILFDWKAELKVKRYYHAFTKSELREIIKGAGLKIKELYKDKYNYYVVLIK